ncbi:alpha/beta hydrolase [Nocardioides sp. CBS4Y-1]|uniref:Alpha/beta hydrolase n=2 Tax=Nocardioides acrostichi TaxID=2784339 RepID=A0A930Y6N5_9ACTN|nr:alpha/beta hydrolase [Nocardioides acrostichi]
MLKRSRTAVERALLSRSMGLPPAVQRRLAGPPVEVDGQRLAVDTQLMLRLQKTARLPAADTLPTGRARAQTRHETALAGGDQPIGSVRDLTAGGRPARLYVPAGAADVGPLLVFFHGGGFFVGDLDTHDASCRVLAHGAGVRVLAVDYRLAPEHPFPAAHDDAEAAYHWAVDHARELGADPARIAVGGDSAGGTLAAATALHAARTGLPCAAQMLVYPAVDPGRGSDPENRSSELFAEGFYLTSGYMERANEAYLGDPSGDTDAGRDPRMSLVLTDLAAVADRLAPAYVCTAGFDPLRDEGERYARLLSSAGVAVTTRRFDDQIHGFFNVVGVGRTARACVDEIAAWLGSALGQTPGSTPGQAPGSTPG